MVKGFHTSKDKTHKSSGKTSEPIVLHIDVDNEKMMNHDVNMQIDDMLDANNEDCVKIEYDDIQDEIDYWNSSIVCYVFGANPPINVMEGFFRRIWRNLAVDKVALASHGVFLVRFTTMENRDKVLAMPRPTFDHKPVFLKAWEPDMEICKEEVRTVPIWVQIWGLDFKYWGEKALPRIMQKVGKFTKNDNALNRGRNYNLQE